jgi:membrane protease YdiL (CAAX protease family)
MTESNNPTPRKIPATYIIHQEGVIAVIGLVGTWLRDHGLATAFAARGDLIATTLYGAAAGLGCFFLLWLVRSVPALRELEIWQRRMVEGWSLGDGVAVAIFSGFAEEALIRALLQPLIGLVPAAAIFAALHFVPDRRLWMWPVIALVLGLVIGVVFARWGYPAAAATHVVVNALSLTRFRVTESS